VREARTARNDCATATFSEDLAVSFALGVDRGLQEDFVDADGREFAS
jgi:hypothetical protein